MSRWAGRWFVSLNFAAADLHPARRHAPAAINLDAWADAHAARDREATGPDPNARRGEGSDQRTRAGDASPDDAETRHAAA